MKALTVWQPWATLIAIGAKPYEFRGWAAPRSLVGQRIAIHAGARPIKRDEVAELVVRLRSNEAWSTGLIRDPAIDLLERVLAAPGMLARSAIVCTAELGTPVLASTIMGEFGGPKNDSDRDQHSNFAWPMHAIEPVIPAVEAKGAQGFWQWGRSA